MAGENLSPDGLTSKQAAELLAKYGRNELVPGKKQGFLGKMLSVLREPMFLLLIASAVIYFVLGEPRDGAVMLVFVIGVVGIEAFQEWKTDRTLSALKKLSEPAVSVMRDGKTVTVPSAELVPGDVMLISEGVKIPADGKVLRASDLRVDESSLTGESEGVWKTAWPDAPSGEYWRKDYCYSGTLVTQGSAAVLVDKTGRETEYGKIGVHIASAPDRPTPLEKQIGRVVKASAAVAAVFCLLAIGLTFFNLADHPLRERLIESVLSGITLSMAMIPEEFPVILAVFLSMGAWRLAKKNSLIRRLPAVEALGAVSVLCVDKTGTITENRMAVAETWCPSGDPELLSETMGLACETDAYDPMEQAMLEYCAGRGITREHLFRSEFVSEYAFTNEAKMMGHVWIHDGEPVVAAKGSPESILNICEMTGAERREAVEKALSMAEAGLRVIAAGFMRLESAGDAPDALERCRLTFAGLVGLADPPREGVGGDIARCLRAGIRVIMITGDNGVTAGAIARKVGIPGWDRVCTGAELESLDEAELRGRVRTANIFSRVLPVHKTLIVKALRENGEVVAMTGDGVNDAPALKHADIGIAMGGRGSEVSREAADMVLLDDNFSTIVETVRDGRRIFENIKKAIGYVFTVHIPIAFAALLAPLLKIDPSGLMLMPVHVVLLELVIDPTCSIVLERQPAERDVMERPPRGAGGGVLSRRTLVKSLAQGIAVFAASFGMYYSTWLGSGDGALARSSGLCVLFMANLFLVMVNSSERDSVLVSLKLLARDGVMRAVGLATVAAVLVMLYTPLNGILKLEPLPAARLLLSVAAAAVSVFWYELVKLAGRRGRARRAGGDGDGDA